jgi:predicted lipoprotein with Yx(FWY)xxD motif
MNKDDSEASRTGLASVAGIPLVALALTGCGSSGASGTSATTATAAAASPAPATAQAATVDVGSTNLGSILVNSQGRTLYLFEADMGTTSACSGACAQAWPPLMANGQPTTGDGADSSLIGTTQRSDGSSQVTYDGHPVYTFAKDQSAGDTNGEGIAAFGGAWYALSPTGTPVQAAAAPTSSATSSNSATSSGY